MLQTAFFDRGGQQWGLFTDTSATLDLRINQPKRELNLGPPRHLSQSKAKEWTH